MKQMLECLKIQCEGFMKLCCKNKSAIVVHIIVFNMIRQNTLKLIDISSKKAE